MQICDFLRHLQATCPNAHAHSPKKKAPRKNQRDELSQKTQLWILTFMINEINLEQQMSIMEPTSFLENKVEAIDIRHSSLKKSL